MSKKNNWLGLAVLIVCIAITNLSEGTLIKNPDENTLWLEDGVDVKIVDGRSDEEGYWRTDKIDIKSSEKGGIVFNTVRGDNTGCCLPVNPEYPYLVWEITDVKAKEGYKGFGLFVFEATWKNGMGMTTYIQKGIYAFNALLHYPNPRDVEFFRMDLYNAEITMKYLKMVKTPEYYIEVISPAFNAKKRLDLGDIVTFRVNMIKSAEDVSLTFFHAYTMPQLKINGEQQLQLKPKNGNTKIWEATVKINSCESDILQSNEQFAAGQFLIKATILGGGVNVPVWGINSYEFRLK